MRNARSKNENVFTTPPGTLKVSASSQTDIK
jgi:hypothetical protein